MQTENPSFPARAGKVESLSVCSSYFCDIVGSTVRVSSFIHMVLQNQGHETQFLIPADSDSGHTFGQVTSPL